MNADWLQFVTRIRQGSISIDVNELLTNERQQDLSIWASTENNMNQNSKQIRQWRHMFDTFPIISENNISL